VSGPSALTTTPATLETRAQWVDTLRVALIAGVIVVHTATGYVTDIVGWYYDDELEPSTLAAIAFALPILLGAIFGLGPLFLVAGWFSVGSLDRHAPTGFLASRLVRLGIPLLLTVLLITPLADLVGNLWQEDRSFLDYLAMTELSVMWFVAALLACSIGYAVLRAIRPRTGTRARPGRRAAVSAGVVIGSVSLVVWQFSTLVDNHLMNLRLGAWTQAAVLFALGVMAAESGWDGSLTRDAERRLGRLAGAGLLAVSVVLAVAGAQDRIEELMRDVNAASVTFAALYGLVSVAFPLWCLAWVRRRWPTHGEILAKAGRGSYATYVLHPLVLVGVMLTFRAVPLDAAWKFPLVAAAAVPVCFAVGYGVTRLPGVRRVL
jgi:fucose 4-O-acetylase-like acetyltransferase